MAKDYNRVNKIVNGPDKKDGGHDHRYNSNKDRTPSQKSGDKSKRKQQHLRVYDKNVLQLCMKRITLTCPKLSLQDSSYICSNTGIFLLV